MLELIFYYLAGLVIFALVGGMLAYILLGWAARR